MKPTIRWRLLGDGCWMARISPDWWMRVPDVAGMPDGFVADVVSMNVFGEAWGEGEGEHVS
jgi:hypothetical protein